MEHAQAIGDISTVLSIIVSSSSLTTTDYVKKTCGGILFLYYTFVENLHIRPVDLNDLIDGILFLDAKNYITKQHMDKVKQQYARNH